MTGAQLQTNNNNKHKSRKWSQNEVSVRFTYMRKILCGKQQFAENSPKSTEKKPKTARTFVSDKKKNPSSCWKILELQENNTNQCKTQRNTAKHRQKVAQEEKLRKQRQIKVLQSSTFWQNENAKVIFIYLFFSPLRICRKWLTQLGWCNRRCTKKYNNYKKSKVNP